MKWIFALIAGFASVGFSHSQVNISTEFTKVMRPSPEVTGNSDELIFAHVLYRHGARNIAKTYPKDPYNDEKYWPGGFGQLTHEGKTQQFKLGQYFRRRYNKLIGGKYSANKIYIQSTDTDRTLMSAQANLAGFFPPTTKDEKWNDDIFWQPIPVHTIPHLLDHVLSGGKECMKYETAFKEYMKESKEVQRIYNEYDVLFKHWSRMTGANISTIPQVNDLYDTIKIEKKYQKKIKRWAEEAIKPNGIMEYITKYSYAVYTNTKLLARLKGGFLLKDILDHFTQKISSESQTDRVLHTYAAHDYTISNILNGLGVFELHIPPYACSIHFELYKTCDNMHYLQIFYRKSEEENPKPINIPGCGEKCPLDQFYDLFQDIIPGDFDTECYLSS